MSVCYTNSKLAVYCCINKTFREEYLLQNADINVTILRRTVKEDGTWKVLELEDKEYASHIEVMFTDLQVLVKYGDNLVNLKWAHTATNGVDVLMKSLRKDEPFPKYTLTKNPGAVSAPLISEYVIGQILANERNEIYTNRRHIPSLTIGILGVGQIGKHLAKTCKGFGLTVWGMSRREPSPDNKCPDVDVFRTTEKLIDLLQNCDYICNTLPSTPQTTGMLSGDVFKACSLKKSIFINVGRGDVVDEQSLINAIKNGWLGGAILDVFRREPLPVSSPLWNLPGVIVTPHVSGWSSHPSYNKNMTGFFFENCRRYKEGLSLEGVFDWTQGY